MLLDSANHISCTLRIQGSEDSQRLFVLVYVSTQYNAMLICVFLADWHSHRKDGKCKKENVYINIKMEIWMYPKE